MPGFRAVSIDVFGHLLALDHAFHVKRKTGTIMRILDRGTTAIQDTVEVVMFNVLPQLVDIVAACSYLAAAMQVGMCLGLEGTVDFWIASRYITCINHICCMNKPFVSRLSVLIHATHGVQWIALKE